MSQARDQGRKTNLTTFPDPLSPIGRTGGNIYIYLDGALALLDTDLLSEVIKLRDAVVRLNALAYTQVHGQLAFSSVTRYEIIRGYRD